MHISIVDKTALRPLDREVLRCALARCMIPSIVEKDASYICKERRDVEVLLHYTSVNSSSRNRMRTFFFLMSSMKRGDLSHILLVY
jgi:hypothetical protein